MIFVAVTIGVILIYLAIEYRYYILYFFALVKNKAKYDSELKTLMKQNVKKRIYKDETIRKYIDYINKVFEEQVKGSYTFKGDFVIREDLSNRLLYSRFNNDYIKELYKCMLEHFEIKEEELPLEIKSISSRTYTPYFGLYDVDNKKVTLVKDPYITLDTLVAVLAHECTHHFLLSRHIELKGDIPNELLTDLTTIYLGFGKYLYEGYKDNRRVIYDGEFNVLVDGNKAGYLAYGDIKYAIKYIKEINRQKNENKN